MKIILTGSTGFVGRHFQNIQPIVSLHDENNNIIDLRDCSALEKYFQRINPDAVIHLAAQSFVPQSFKDPIETYSINFFGTLNLLQALKNINFAGRFLYVGSGDVYGAIDPVDLPIAEITPLKPRSPYAVSKVSAEALCYQWSQTENFEIVLARPFNQIGPGQSSHFAISNFAKQLIEIKAGMRPSYLEVGNLDVSRDFTDVRDAVRAYLLLLKEGKNGEIYNICSNREVTLKTILQQLLNMVGLTDDQLTIIQMGDRARKNEQQRVWGDASKIYNAVNWKPEISLQQSLKDIVHYWENMSLCEKKQ